MFESTNRNHQNPIWKSVHNIGIHACLTLEMEQRVGIYIEIPTDPEKMNLRKGHAAFSSVTNVKNVSFLLVKD